MPACTLLLAALACAAGCSGARAAPADAYEQLAALAGTPQGHVVRLALQPQRGAHEPLEFLFVGATNLPNPDASHMRRVLSTFSDHDHFTEQWAKSENGKDTVFDLHFVRR